MRRNDGGPVEGGEGLAKIQLVDNPPHATRRTAADGREANAGGKDIRYRFPGENSDLLLRSEQRSIEI